MQITRLFEIVYLLLSKECMTASELAAHFEVSQRTIYRDIDALSGAGIPVYATKGKGGGIRLMPGFTMKKAYLTQEEKNNILSALQAFKAARVPDADVALRKLGGLFNLEMPEWIAVEFSPWGEEGDEKFMAFKEAILMRRVVSFVYYNVRGEKKTRLVEPNQLWYKHRGWYLRAFCLEQQAPRLFKLGRISDVRMTQRECVHPYQEVDQSSEDVLKAPNTKLKLRIEKRLAYRVYDEFEEAAVQEQEDGSFFVTVSMIEDDWMYGYLTTFGADVTVLEPERVRWHLKQRVKWMYDKYFSS
ncbi:YafY family transcriptional regulator [Christensenellaceae bacterium OttesenSCG-928-M15]|nr:YafY family transcriptional regulator [Christensenellaceae bacterium OttesenSCG-928-M15]